MTRRTPAALLLALLTACGSKEAARAQPAEVRADLGVEAGAVDSPAAAAQDAAVIVTATTAREPVLRAEWLAPGTHVNAAGANMLLRRELDDQVIARAGLVAVDSLDQARRAARGKDVSLAGGAKAAQHYLNAGLVDEMLISLVPILLGRGERLFDGIGDDLHGLELARTVATPNVTHLELVKR